MVTILLLSLSSCAFIKAKIPELKQSVATKVTDAIVKTGQCTNIEAVRSDVNDLLKLESAQGMVANAIGSEAPAGSQQEGVISEICKAAARLALPVLLRKGVPTDWACQLTDLDAKMGELAIGVCTKIKA